MLLMTCFIINHPLKGNSVYFIMMVKNQHVQGKIAFSRHDDKKQEHKCDEVLRIPLLARTKYMAMENLQSVCHNHGNLVSLTLHH